MRTILLQLLPGEAEKMQSDFYVWLFGPPILIVVVIILAILNYRLNKKEVSKND